MEEKELKHFWIETPDGEIVKITEDNPKYDYFKKAYGVTE